MWDELWKAPWSARALGSGEHQGGNDVLSLACPPFPLPSQRCLDWNRDILKKELGLTEQDIIDLPALFKMDEDRQARAYFPNMVRRSGPQTPSRPIRGQPDPEGAPGLKPLHREARATVLAELLCGPGTCPVWASCPPRGEMLVLAASPRSWAVLKQTGKGCAS